MVIDWSNITCAHGDPQDIPAHLCDMLSDNPEVREHARASLYKSALDQGTPFEAAAHVVPQLVDVILNPSCPDRFDVFRMIVDFALRDDICFDGSVPFDAEEHFQGAELLSGYTEHELADMQRRWLEEDGLAVEYCDAFVVLWAREAYDALADRSTEFLSLLDAEDERIVCQCIAVLHWFPHIAAASVASLIARCLAQKSDYFQINANLSLGFLAAHAEQQRAAEHLEHVLRNTHDPFVRVTAAVGLFHALGDQLPKNAIRVLKDYVQDPAKESIPRDCYIWWRPIAGRKRGPRGFPQEALDELQNPRRAFKR